MTALAFAKLVLVYIACCIATVDMIQIIKETIIDKDDNV